MPATPWDSCCGSDRSAAHGGEQALEERAEGAALMEVLGMPLDADAERYGRQLDAFDDAVRRDGRGLKARRDQVHRLVVPAVDPHHVVLQVIGQEPGGQGPGRDPDVVRDRIARILDLVVQRRSDLARDVLHERAAGSHVQHLDAATDGQQGETGLDREKMIIWRKEVEDLIGLEEYYRIESETVER